MKNPEMLEALSALAVEKGISEEIMLEALANALVTAYKRMPEAAEEALVEIDVETGEIRVIATSSPGSSSRPTRDTRCSTWAGSRRCCRKPSRFRAIATTTVPV